jgi:muramoyltetrapeptide carboxypeptidase
MRRRTALGVLGIAATTAAGKRPRPEIIKPEALSRGDLIGLITPATYVADPDRLALAERTLEYFGLRARMGRNVKKRSGYVGGTTEERLEDLHEMFRVP